MWGKNSEILKHKGIKNNKKSQNLIKLYLGNILQIFCEYLQQKEWK